MRLTRNEVKISFKKSGFIVDPEKKTTLCRLHFEVLLPRDIDGEVFFKEVKNTYVDSVAVCCDEDEFDQRTGQKIALAKAENRAYELVNNSLRKVKIITSGAQKTERIASLVSKIVETFDAKSKSCIQHNISYIEKVSSKKD